MSIYSPVAKSGPCKYLDGTRKQNHQCRRDSGLPEALREAKKLALTHCEEQFKYDRWNCSIETRGKRNIFKKVCTRKFLLPINKRILKIPINTFHNVTGLQRNCIRTCFNGSRSHVPNFSGMRRR
jgi:wnt family